ncbi:inositol monophosphatase family protein [Bacillus chungangensis]|uniref:inositol-phosphate phosphatase n=1 Tax=Bacillus chungangensis TaxID=587633 RepID=A0ABT9WWA7_9BACI|nr:inositol monophosphatase family protein [Bacillus chungangensis]MDQ0177015.1 myo-inositol-1(or 4)-monophosphatase [Bacillus chungangensis]
MGEKQIDAYVKKWLKEARQRIIRSFDDILYIQTKSDKSDLVTNIDKEIEQFFIRNIRTVFPGHHIIGEEGFGDDLKRLDGTVWLIDPIDGTMNFVHQQRNFMISIGVYEDGVGKYGYIYDVIHDELYYAIKGKGAYFNDRAIAKLREDVAVAEALISINASWLTRNYCMDASRLIQLVKDVRGTRSYGSAALEFAYVATGRLDAYLTMRLSPWDFAAGKIIVEELGGIVTTLKGEPLKLLEKNAVLVSKPGLHKQLLTYLR